MEVDGGQPEIEIHQPHHQRHYQIDKHSGKGIANSLTGLTGFCLLALEGICSIALGGVEAPRLKAAGIKTAEIEYERHETMSSFCLLHPPWQRDLLRSSFALQKSFLSSLFHGVPAFRARPLPRKAVWLMIQENCEQIKYSPFFAGISWL